MSLIPGQAPNDEDNIAELAEALLQDLTTWPDDQRRNLAEVASWLVKRIPDQACFFIGLSGPPGSGKSTLARLLSDLLTQRSRDSLVISLDDYYLGKQDRLRLASRHPLFAQRGVPGTHDWGRLLEDLERIRDGRIGNLKLPKFDKLNDDRYPQEFSVPVLKRPAVIFLEGWLIGSPAQSPDALVTPVNDLEAFRDREGHWRKAVNANLATYHDDLVSLLNARWYMKPPGWQQVIDWRWQQECEKSKQANRTFLESRDEVVAFLDQFQRIAIHMNDSCHQWADVIINIDTQHRLTPIRNVPE